MRSQFGLERNTHNPRPQLRHAVVGRMQQTPLRHIAEFAQLHFDAFPVFSKHRAEQTPHVFQHHCTGSRFTCQPDGLREEVAVIVSPELFAGHRKRRTRHTTGQQINTAMAYGVKGFHVAFNHVPKWSVEPQRLTSAMIQFNERAVIKTRHLQTQCLATSTGANLN